MMGYAVFWVLFAFAVGVLAANRGRSALGWTLLSLVISPLLGLIFCLVSKDLTPANLPNESTHRRCPACAEFILPDAVVCKHCGSAVEKDQGFQSRLVQIEKAKIHAENAKILKGVLIFLGVLLVLWML
jgi:predicted nucleic acid-binding Zn ribbon protein